MSGAAEGDREVTQAFATIAVVAEGESLGDPLGWPGDLDGDGIDDLWIGAEDTSDGTDAVVGWLVLGALTDRHLDDADAR